MEWNGVERDIERPVGWVSEYVREYACLVLTIQSTSRLSCCPCGGWEPPAGG